MVLENEIKSAWETAVSLTRTERGTFLAIMAVALVCIIFLVVYFLSSINWIVADHNRALAEQRKEFIEAQKVRDAEFVAAIYGIKNWEKPTRY